jgi:hypothetical protein
MKCPKCRYTSFPHLENCRKCGFGLAEQRAALGIYALQPNPPDLLVAYEAGSPDISGGMPTPSIYAHGIASGGLEGIDLEVAEAEPGGAGTDEIGAPTMAPEEADSDRLSTQDMVIPDHLELQQLGDITLPLDNAAGLESESPPGADAPGEFADVKQVYDLDVGEDLGGLSFGRPVEEVGADDDDGEAVEFTLEIEEDIEFEVDRLELEQDSEGDDEDDDER